MAPKRELITCPSAVWRREHAKEHRESLEGKLQKAAETGDLPTLQHLIAQGADFTANKNKALRLAARGGHINIVNRLLDEKDTNAEDYKNLALQWAAEAGQLDIVKVLVQHEQQKYGKVLEIESVALAAATSRHCETARFLIEYALQYTVNHGGENTFYALAAIGDLPRVQCIVSARYSGDSHVLSTAFKHAANAEQIETMRWMLHTCGDVMNRGSISQAAYRALYMHRPAVMDAILESPHAARLSLGDVMPCPWDRYQHQYQDGDVDVLRRVMQIRAFDHMHFDDLDALIKAAGGPKLELVKMVLEHTGIDPSFPRHEGTALSTAIRFNRLDIVDYLLADPRVVSAGLDDALEMAARDNRLTIVNQLIAKGASPGAKDSVAVVSAMAAMENRKGDTVLRRLLQDDRVSATHTKPNHRHRPRRLVDWITNRANAELMQCLVAHRGIRESLIPEDRATPLLWPAVVERRLAIVALGQVLYAMKLHPVYDTVAAFIFGKQGVTGMGDREVQWLRAYSDGGKYAALAQCHRWAGDEFLAVCADIAQAGDASF